MSREIGRIGSRRHAPLLPRGEAREGALFMVMAIICALACLSLLSARAAYRAADRWTASLAGSMTIRLMTPDDPLAAASDLRTAAIVLDAQRGVVKAKAIDKKRAEKLLEPWFGHGPLPDDLPLPSLIELQVDPVAPPAPKDLERVLRAEGLNPRIDDHRRWSGSVSDAAGALRIGAVVVLVLLAAAASATVSFASRAGLEARRDIVEALHLVGAQDRYISSLFEHRFLGLGLRAGLFGAFLATCGAAGIVLWLRNSGASALLVGEIPLQAPDILVLALAPLAAGLIGMWTARASVMGALKRLD